MKSPTSKSSGRWSYTPGDYIWASPDSEVGANSMWSIPVIRTPNIAVGTFLVAALTQSAMLFQREMLTMVIAFQDQDDFIRNLCTLRAEERVALSVLLPKGLITGTFAGTVAQTSHNPAHASHAANATKK